MPASVPTVLLHPVRIAACLGAMSSRLTLMADIAKAELATARLMLTVAEVWLFAKAANARKTANPPKPPQPKIFLTVVVLNFVFILKRSARRPLRGTTMVMTI